MTNPPQNPKVRKMLLEQLSSNGIDLDIDEWPLPPVKHPARQLIKRTSWGWPTTSLVSLSEQRSGGIHAVESTRKAIVKKWMNAPEVLSTTHGRCRGQGGRKENTSATGRTERNVEPNEATLAKDVQDASRRSGSIDTANMGKNGNRARRHSSSRRVSGAGGGSPAGNNTGGKLTFGAPRCRSKDSVAKSAEETWQTSTKVVQRSYTETDLRNNIDALRTSGRAHRAAVGDRFRLGVDLFTPGSLVLSGASAAANPPGAWSSDASELNLLHNSAMRQVNPSNMRLLPMPEKRRKKKGEEDETQLSESGLFFARYDGNQALKSLKAMKRNFQPEEEIKKAPSEETPKVVTEDLRNALRMNFGSLSTAIEGSSPEGVSAQTV
eukprot:TRINITY_DN15851_c1_g1_i1.p1 TRINITY_DN15851_c1_g1~~TRINITY_DN15851_c1_g1_i1.p1  ORF type:complete len:423 (-),score=81.47 TRINITY_DN15851_c1_g1_i1:35-1174(-)